MKPGERALISSRVMMPKHPAIISQSDVLAC